MATAASPSPSDILSAVTAAGSSPSTDALSAPAQALISALDSGLGEALGLGASLSTAGIEAVSSIAGNIAGDIAGDVASTTADIVGDVAEAIPIVGQVLKGLISLLTLGLSGGPDLAALCQTLAQRYPPTQTGSIFGGGATAPADHFSRVHGVDLFYADDDAAIDYAAPPPIHAGGGATSNGVWIDFGTVSTQNRNFLELGPAAYRSAYGMAWMQVIEGSIADVRDYHWKAYLAALHDLIPDADRARLSTPEQAAAAWQAAVDRDRRLAAQQWHKQTGQRRGLTDAEVQELRALRRGIEASYGPKLPRGARSDGGAALWIAWLDRVASAFRRGALSWDFVTWLLTRQRPAAEMRGGVAPADGPWGRQVETLLQLRPDADYLDNTDLVAAPPTWIWEDQACAQTFADALRQTLDSWDHAISPYYAQGQRGLADLEAQGRAAGVASVQRRGHRIGSASPPAVDVAGVSSGPDSSSEASPSRLLGLGILATVAGLLAWRLRQSRAGVRAAPFAGRSVGRFR
jgi:hypothetical protein